MILAPGVQNTTDLRSRKAAFNNGLSQWSSDGAGEKRNDFTIDGVANVAADRVAYSPPSAAVEEFKIQTASYDAAVGNAMGASVNLVTKSGTNSLRGQVYEWFRGADLDAPNYFDKKAGRPKRDYKDNRFGAAVGGPIATQPHVLFRQLRGQSVPGAARRSTLQRADRKDAHRRFLGTARARIAVPDLRSRDDPSASDPGRPVHSRSVPRQHHSGTSRISPVAKNILGFYPLPNQAGTADGANNYTNPTAVAFETYYTATTRVDHNLSRSAPHLRPLQLGLLGRGEGRSLRQRRRPASSSIARTACSRSTTPTRSRTTC